jgi:hypothetical protein
MKARQLIIVLVLLAIVGTGALLLNRRHAASWSQTASQDTKILNFQLNDVSHVVIKGPDTELNLIKKEDVWTVKERADYPADFDKVSTLIRKLWELRPVQDVKVGKSQLGQLQLVEPGHGGNSGTLLDLKGTGDKRLAELLLGKKHLRNLEQSFGGASSVPAGRYVMAENRAFLISDPLEDAEPKPEYWIAHDFIKIENPKSITVVGAQPAMNWKLDRETTATAWKFADGKPGELDAGKAASLASVLANPTFTDVMAPDASPSETGLDKPSTTRIETFDNFVYDLRIGKLIGENYPVLVSVKADLPKERAPKPDEKPEDKARLDQEFQTKQKELADKLAKEQKIGNRPYLIAKGTIDQLLKDRSTLIAEKTSSPSPTAATTPVGAAKGPSPTPSPRRKPK